MFILRLYTWIRENIKCFLDIISSIYLKRKSVDKKSRNKTKKMIQKSGGNSLNIQIGEVKCEFTDEETCNNINMLIKQIHENAKLKNIEKRELCFIILEYIEKRIMLLKHFFEGSFVLRWTYDEKDMDKAINIYKELLNDNDKEDINFAKDEISKHYLSHIKIIINKFLKCQNESLIMICEDLSYTDKELHKYKKNIYHNEIRDTLSEFIKVYNKVLLKIQESNECLEKNLLENPYDNKDTIVLYKNNKEKIRKFQIIIEELNKIENGMIQIYLDKNDKPQKLKTKFTEAEGCQFFNGFLLEEKAIYEILKFLYEVFDEKEEGRFAPQIYTNHVFFLHEISKELKYQLLELKTRCNIKFYYFEKKV